MAAATLADTDVSLVRQTLADLTCRRLGLASHRTHHDVNELLLYQRSAVEPLSDAATTDIRALL